MPTDPDLALEELWAAYEAAERRGVHSSRSSALDAFVAAISARGASIADPWALMLAELVVDLNEPTPIRHPLLRHVLAPALVRGVLAEGPGCARWLAILLSKANSVLELPELPGNMRTPEGLLLEALRVDPLDHRARRPLVELRARYLEYTLHELPSGVLYGHHGASIQQCDELLELLTAFRADVEVLGADERYAALIRDCTFHYRNYREYLERRQAGDSYAVFLARTGPGAAPGIGTYRS